MVYDSNFETGTMQFNCGAQAGRPGTSNKCVHGCPPLQKVFATLCLHFSSKMMRMLNGENKPSHLQEFSSALGMLVSCLLPLGQNAEARHQRTSGVTSKAANGGHFKTGQRNVAWD
jgi:hypothetical protein